jgi:hypothetical protein
MPMRKLHVAILALVATLVLTAVPASAEPRVIAVATHMPPGVTPSSMAIGPEGTAYVQGARLSREELVPEVYVYNTAGALLRKFAIPPETAIEAFGNGQLYVGREMAEHLYGLDPQSGARISEVGAQNEGFPGGIGFPRGLAVAPAGTIYESGGEIGVPERGDPESIETIHPIETFTANGLYSGYIQPQFATAGGVAVLAVNSSGDVLGGWATAQGIGAEGLVSPQGAALTQFNVFPPHPEVKGPSFTPDGNSIYAGVVLEHGAKGTTFIARLSLSGKILQRFGSIPTHNVANFWEYDSAEVAADGAGWALRSVPGKLYRFHV